MKALKATVAPLLAVLGSAATGAPVLVPLFTDHAVPQRDRPIPVFGTAAPGEALTVTLGSDTAKTVADAKGRWHLVFPARAASAAPVALTVKGADDSLARASDILVGDVWLCSGQSNMELQVSRALNSANEIPAADDPLLRLVTVPRASALVPATTTASPLTWAGASPGNVGDFSAACYYMAKALRARNKVPVGAIAASWGGTQISTWLDPAGTTQVAGPEAAKLRALYATNPLAANTRFAPVWEDWWRRQSGDAPGREPWAEPGRKQWLPLPAVTVWDRWPGGAFADHTGWMWMRRTIRLTPAQARQGGVLSLGVVDDADETFVNGRPVGNSFGWDTARDYRVPAAMWKAGDNEVVIAVGNSWGTGGLQGPADRLKLTLADGTVLPLGSGWVYFPTGVASMPPRPPWDAIGGMGLIYNGMIAPLGTYALKGVAWYQGESDVGLPGYRTRLGALMKGWRTGFAQAELPFLIVGLANYGPFATAPTDSSWAALREEQRHAVLGDANAALVSAFDIGERTDIHPGNKQAVGQRLADAAAALTDRDASATAPAVQSVGQSSEAILVTFSGVKGGLHSCSGSTALGFELCGIGQASCRFAVATASGSTVRLALDGKPVTRIRYGWADSPVVNLYDERPLPPGPFEMPLGSNR